MIREILAPRGIIIFLILWACLTAALLYWNRASRDQHKTWLSKAKLPAISAGIAMLIMFVIVFLAQP